MNCRIILITIATIFYTTISCTTINSLEPFGDQISLGSDYVLASLAWCGDCDYLAAGGYNSGFTGPEGGSRHVYSFNPSNSIPLSIVSTIAGDANYSVAWCDGCTYLAAGGQNNSEEGFLQAYHFYPGQVGPLALLSSDTISANSYFYSTAWCGDNCNYLAAGGFNSNNQGIINVYSYDSTASTLSLVASDTISNDSNIYSIAWCGDNCNYLAAAGYNSSGEGLVSVYSFESTTSTLALVTSETTSDAFYSVAWCDNCNYLAVGGYDSSNEGLVSVYSYDSTTSTLSLVASDTISAIAGKSNVYSVAWCGDNCNYLAAGGFNDNGEGLVNIYSYDSTNSTLSLVTSETISNDSAFNSVAWCGDNCNYLAVGGYDSSSEGIINVYSFSSTASTLSLVISETISNDSEFNSVAWCDNCNYLAAGGRNSSSEGIINIYSFSSTASTLSYRVSVVIPSTSAFYSAPWCGDNCGYLAVGGYNSNNEGVINVYAFDAEQIFGTIIPGKSTIDSISWCDNCNYLAAGGVNSSDQGIINIYSFEPTTSALTLVASDTISASGSSNVYSIAWCGDNCNYLAAVGYNDSSDGIINIYSFSSTTSTLSLVVSKVIPTSTFTGVAWHNDCNYLAAVGYNSIYEGIVNLYTFDSDLLTLSLITSATINVADANYINAVAWCQDGVYISVGGYEANGIGSHDGFIQLYRTETNILAAPTVQARKSSYRFPAQRDIVNTLCWNKVTDAVAYNVYANVGKTIHLAHITMQPYCYSQHQIIPGVTKTYYVTAVDADGNESEATVVTI